MKKRQKRKENKKHSVFSIIGLGFKKWWQNFVIVVPFIFNALAFVIGALILLLIFSSLFVTLFHASLPLKALQELMIAGAAGQTTLSPEIISALTNLLVPSTIIYFIFVGIISVLILGLIKAYFYSGAIAMAKDLFINKKTDLKVMNKAGKKFLWRYWLVGLVIILGILIWLFIFSLPLLITQNISLLAIPILSLIPLIFVFVLFALADYFIVLENLSVLESIKRSIFVVKKSYWSMFGLGLLFLLMSSIVGMIPWVGSLVSLLVIIPIQTIAFVLFALERSYRR